MIRVVLSKSIATASELFAVIRVLRSDFANKEFFAIVETLPCAMSIAGRCMQNDGSKYVFAIATKAPGDRTFRYKTRDLRRV